MSSVPQRKRQMSEMQFYVNAIKIRTEVLSIVENEKYVSKRKRLLIGNDTFYHSKNVVEFIVMANAIYPHTKEMLFARKWYQQKAICECEVLIESLRIIVESSRNSSSKRLMSVISEIINEVQLLRAWRNSSKLTADKSKRKSKVTNTTGCITDGNSSNDTTNESSNIEEIAFTGNTDSLLQLMVLLEESWPIDRNY